MHVSPAFSYLHINGAFREQAATSYKEELPRTVFVTKRVGIQQYRLKEDLYSWCTQLQLNVFVTLTERFRMEFVLPDNSVLILVAEV